MAIRKEFWRLAWPAAAEGLLLMLLTAADLLMVSSLGNTAVAAGQYFFPTPYGDPLRNPLLLCCTERLCCPPARRGSG